MNLNLFELQQSNNTFFRNLTCYFFNILITFVISIIISKLFWAKHNGAIHTLIELSCIIVAFTSFIIVWNRYDQNSVISQIVAYGFLAVAAFDTLHTYYYPILGFYPEGYYDLATRFWIWGRFTEAVVLLLVTLELKNFKLSKRLGLCSCLLFIFGVYYLVIYHSWFFPVLFTANGFTPAKIFLELIVIAVLFAALWNLKKKLYNKETFDYQYLFVSIILFITSELCFISYASLYSLLFVWGHMLKAASYYYIFKGIIEIEINRPYLLLEQTTKRLADILDAVPIAITTFDQDLRFYFANKKFEEMAGCKKEMLKGLSGSELLNIFPKAEATDEKPLLDTVAHGDENTNTFVRTYQNLKGETLKALLKICKIESGALILLEDVKQLQEIDNLNLQTTAILNSIPCSVFIADTGGNITMCNNAFGELVGMDKELLLGMNLQDLDQTVYFSRADLGSKLVQGEPAEGSFQASLITPSGTTKEIMINLSHVRNIDNEIIGVLSISQDITEEKANQQKLINQEKLALLGQMGASIVHETRNFLTTIMGCSQLIDQTSQDGKVKQYAKKIYADILEVNRIISDFLTLSKPREMLLDEVAINDLVASMQSTLVTSSLMKGVTLNLFLEDIERYIECDESMIRQVVLNMCKNAVEAMAKTPDPKLTIRTELNEEANEVILSISDNGKGISKENLSKIGTAFFTTKSSGTGLGLNVCFQIIQDHKGRIEIVSELGKGTTFTITLPCIGDDDLEEDLDEPVAEII